MVQLLFAGWLALGAGLDVELQPLAGEKVSGPLVELSGEKVVVETAEGPKSFELTEVLSLDRPNLERSLDRPDVWIDLVDGSRLLAQNYTVSNREATVKLLGGSQVTLPTRSIVSVQLKFHEPAGPLAQQWNQALKAKPTGDLLVIRRSMEALDQLEGILGDVGESVQFEFKGRKISAPRDKLEGLIYFQPINRQLSSPMCRVTDYYGTQWAAKSLKLDNGQIEVTSVAGVTAKLSADNLRKLDFAGGIVFLSSLSADQDWKPFVNLPALKLLKNPKAVAKFHTAQAEGTTLVIPGGVSLVYRLPDDYHRFQAVATMDERIGKGADVRLIVSGDGKELIAKTIVSQEPPVPIDVDITGVGRLAVFVDYGEKLDRSGESPADVLTLLKARITK